MKREALLRKISSGVAKYLRSDEAISRVVSAQTLSQIWQILPVVVMLGAFLVAHFVLHANKTLVVAVLAAVFLTYLILNNKVLYRYVVVTNQRVLVVDGGYFGSNPGQKLLGELPRASDADIPAKRWSKIAASGETLYVRYSISASPTDPAPPPSN